MRPGMTTRLIRLSSKVEKALYEQRILSANKLILPDFLCIGAQKCGTTWLYENLRKHPEIFLADKKEIRYFDLNFHRSLKYYSSHFKAGLNKKTGDITPAYCHMQKDRVRFVHAVMPQARLILLIRNPIDRAWSHAYMELVRKSDKTIDEIDEGEFYTYFIKHHSLKAGMYSSMLENWLEFFPEEQLYIGLFEDIETRPRELLTAIFKHIGVSSDVDWNDFPFGDVIIPPAGPEYKGKDPGRGVRVKGKKRSDNLMPEKYRDFLSKIYCPEIKRLHEKHGIKKWLHSCPQ